ncbi:MAG: thymidine phosphorylase [Myxococcales bacterium]|jgi:pyrimidine-nucleoside phosphorylase|nr:thymidine phosphorylase [Myxococcales bacterium]
MDFSIVESIRKKRDGQAWSAAEIRAIIDGVTQQTLPDYQVSALLMAVYFQGMSPEELAVWTDAMRHSGVVLSHPQGRYRVVDKHSTGGVGDKISICLAPAVAACGVKVPMIAGRGLGHTGGTLDKLEAIAGYNIFIDRPAAAQQLEEIGLFIIGQTDDMAPADRRLYALRDVTGTVESIPLISSSIMSKKLAEGIDGLVLDVKVGAGAFMPTQERAALLAETLIGIGRAAGCAVTALLTDMNAPIGRTVGNALETREAIDVLRGEGPADTVALTVALGAEMLLLAGAATSLDEGTAKLQQVLSNGAALERFAQCVAMQGGDADVCEHPERLPAARSVVEIVAERSGVVHAVSPRTVAMASMATGAGRQRAEDQIDPATGVVLHAVVGQSVAAGDVLATLHHNGRGQGEAEALLRTAWHIDDAPVAPSPQIIDRLS